MSRYSLSAIVVVGGLITGAAQGHEFWIEPEVYQTQVGEKIVAAIRVGENFEGASYAYIPNNFKRFELEQAGNPVPIESRVGDRPAVSVAAVADGLAILAHVTRDYELTYSSWEKFVDFVTHKDATWVLAAHEERGFDETSPVEVYSRYGKSLIAVGDGAGQDRNFGMLTEIVALENPYTDDMSDGIDVQVLYQDEPRGDAQIEIFAKDPDGVVEVTTVTTDKSGLATVPVTPGVAYLVDAVVLREPRPSQVVLMGAQWESLWASLTFRIPE